MPYAMSPAPVPEHQKINARLWAIYDNALRTNCDKCEAFLPIDWKISENTVVQPDLLIVWEEIKKKYLDFTPALLIEILSPSTAYKDRHEKFELYEQDAVKYYLIVDPKFKKIEIFELLKGKYKASSISANEFTFILESGCQFSVNFDGIWP